MEQLRHDAQSGAGHVHGNGEHRYRAMWRRLPPAERLLMASRMFSTT